MALISRVKLNLRRPPSFPGETTRERYPQRQRAAHASRSALEFATGPGNAGSYIRTLTWRVAQGLLTSQSHSSDEGSRSGSVTTSSRSRSTTSTNFSSVFGPLNTMGTVREEPEEIEMEEREEGHNEIVVIESDRRGDMP